MSLKVAVLGSGLMLASLTVPALAAEVPISDEARAHFAAGVNLLQDPDGARYEEAYREFKEAYARSPSWKILGNLGITAMKLERDSEAIDAFKKYLAEGGKQIDAEERAQVQRDLSTLESGAARLTLQSEPAGATIEDERFPATGQPIRNAYSTGGAPLVIGVRPGRHRFTAKLAGRTDVVWEVELSPRQEESRTFVMPEPVTAPPPRPAPVASPSPVTPPASPAAEPSGSGLRTGAYVALGAGVVGLGVGTFFGLRARGKYADANAITDDPANCPPTGPCELPGALYDRRERFAEAGDSAKAISIVGFALGGVGLATGVTLFVISGNKSTAEARVQPFVGVGNVGLLGSF
jgi:hypothetical protein